MEFIIYANRVYTIYSIFMKEIYIFLMKIYIYMNEGNFLRTCRSDDQPSNLHCNYH